jgi:hypothetical protein
MGGARVKVRFPRWAPAVALLAVLLSGAACSEDAEPEESPEIRSLRTFLLAWAKGDARYEYFSPFHETGHSSPHRQDTEEYEVSAKAYSYRRDGNASRGRELANELLTLHGSEEMRPEARVRILHLLGRLAAPEGLDVLCRAAEAEDEPAASTAIRSLACFGAVPSEEGFMCYGGTPRWVVLPASPSRRATQVLCGLLRSEPPSWKADAPRNEYRERRDQWSTRRWRVVEALKAHRGREVVEAVIAELAQRRNPRRASPHTQETLLEIVVANASYLRPTDLDALRALSDDTTVRPGVRERVHETLKTIENPMPEEPRKPGVYQLGR